MVSGHEILYRVFEPSAERVARRSKKRELCAPVPKFLYRDAHVGADMQRLYELKYAGDIGEYVETIRKVASKYSVKFTGDASSGSFCSSGLAKAIGIKFKGNYRIEGSRVLVTVLEKPSSFAWSAIDSMIGGLLEQNSEKVTLTNVTDLPPPVGSPA
jgi:hypothetical protein